MAALFKKLAVNKPCEVDPMGAEVCLPTEDGPAGDIVINWSGRGKAVRRYFQKMERELKGFDFQRVQQARADVVVAGRNRRAANDALVDWFVEDGCCEQYNVFQQTDWLDASTQLKILILSDLSGAPGAPK